MMLRPVREHTDERVREIFSQVVQRTGFNTHTFALCETDFFTPTIHPIPELYGRGFAVLLPPYVTTFSDSAVRGLFGHEFGHVSLPMGVEVNFQREVDSDTNALQWVSKDDLIHKLRALWAFIPRFPKVDQDVVRHLIEYRLLILNGETFDHIR